MIKLLYGRMLQENLDLFRVGDAASKCPLKVTVIDKKVETTQEKKP